MVVDDAPPGRSGGVKSANCCAFGLQLVAYESGFAFQVDYQVGDLVEGSVTGGRLQSAAQHTHVRSAEVKARASQIMGETGEGGSVAVVEGGADGIDSGREIAQEKIDHPEKEVGLLRERGEFAQLSYARRIEDCAARIVIL